MLGTVSGMTTQPNTSTLAAPGIVPRSRARASRWAPLPVVLAGTFMVVLDFFIVNVALPSMQHDLHASGGAIEWVVAGYALTSAVFLITAARLGDHIGRRRVFSIGLGLFTLASVACGVAGTPAVLVAARLMQGIGAALLMPNVLTIIGVTYSDSDRARALGAYGLVMGVAAVCGQLIGGVLVQLDIAGLGWRSCFLINVPVGALALGLAPRFVPESRAEHRSGLDLAGTMLVTAGVTAIVLPLVEGRQHGWPLWTWISLAAAPLLLLAFAYHQRRLARGGGTPLIAPALFRARSFTAGLLTSVLASRRAASRPTLPGVVMRIMGGSLCGQTAVRPPSKWTIPPLMYASTSGERSALLSLRMRSALRCATRARSVGESGAVRMKSAEAMLDSYG